jgi:hypothetical protein
LKSIPPSRTPKWFTVLRGAVRLSSLAVIGVIAAFAFGEPGAPTSRDLILLAFFPVGLVIGLLIGLTGGWRREILGGCISVGSMLAFYGIMLARSGSVPRTPYFAILTLPAVGFLMCGLLKRFWSRQSSRS